jgi:hypothetical protein
MSDREAARRFTVLVNDEDRSSIREAERPRPVRRELLSSSCAPRKRARSSALAQQDALWTFLELWTRI